jgi:hypothetical protein
MKNLLKVGWLLIALGVIWGFTDRQALADCGCTCGMTGQFDDHILGEGLTHTWAHYADAQGVRGPYEIDAQDCQAGIATLASSSGYVQINGSPAAVGMRLQPYDLIEVSPGATASIVLDENHGVMTITGDPKEGTTFKLPGPSPGAFSTTWKLIKGLLGLDVNERMNVDAAYETVGIEGTVLSVDSNPGTQQDTVSVQEGKVQVTPKNRTLPPFMLDAGHQVQVGPNNVGPVTPIGSGTPAPAPPGGPSVSGSLLQIADALDTDHNNKIDDDEIKTADVDWTTGQAITGTNLTIGDDAMKQLFQMWVTSEAITAAGTSAASANLSSLQVRAIEARTLDTHSVRFVAEGQGITGMEAQVFDLSGKLIFDQETTGPTLTFRGLGTDGRPLANGVYLYVVTTRGSNGQQRTSEVKKLVLMR